MGLADDGDAVELGERLIEACGLVDVWCGLVAVAGPQGADDALVGVVIVERAIVLPYRQVGTPELGAVRGPLGKLSWRNAPRALGRRSGGTGLRWPVLEVARLLDAALHGLPAAVALGETLSGRPGSASSTFSSVYVIRVPSGTS